MSLHWCVGGVLGMFAFVFLREPTPRLRSLRQSFQTRVSGARFYGQQLKAVSIDDCGHTEPWCFALNEAANFNTKSRPAELIDRPEVSNDVGSYSRFPTSDEVICTVM